MSDEDSDLDSTGFVIMPPPPPPPPPPSPPPTSLRPRYTGKARIIQSSVFASRDSGRPKSRTKNPRKTLENTVVLRQSTHFQLPSDPNTVHDPEGLNNPNARPAHMLSVVELCNNSDEDIESVATTGDVAIETPVHSGDEDGNESGETMDDGWSDHNRWYCNICKDGGELLCCDRCPRAFHMSCLGMSDDMIPDREWYCKMCAECLDRRRLKQESKEKARVMRETEKLERDARRRKAEQMKEEMLAKKSVEAIEHKAKRVLEMQDRILSRKKIKYKDKEEEKLGKMAEELAQTVRSSKEKLEKLEKEDAILRRKEEALKKKKRGMDDIPPEVIEDTSRPDKPTPAPCNFAEIPAKYVGKMLAVWDCIYAFHDILELADITVDQFSRALNYPKHSPMLTEIHMCLLEKILEDREDEDYLSDDEGSMDDSEQYRYEIQHAPLTVGVPTRSMLTPLTWPSILCGLISAVPRYTQHSTPTFVAAFKALQDTDYPALQVQHKLALLQFLVGRLVDTEKIRRVLGKHLNEILKASKEYNRTVMLDRKLTLEDDKKLREKQRIELANFAESNKTSMRIWLGNDKKGRANGDAASADGFEETKSDNDGETGSGSDSDLDDLAYNEEALSKNEEELERLQLQEFISRHEYVSRKKKLDKQRDRLRQRTEVKLRKQKMQEQTERKRTIAKKAITDGLASKDSALLRNAIEKAKECGLPDRIMVSATHVLEIWDAEAVREEEALVKKRKFSALLRQSFVRSEPLGRDRDHLRYWIFRGDLQRLYVERPGPSNKIKRKYESLARSGSPRDGLIPEDDDSNATWYCYSSQSEVNMLMKVLDARVPREACLHSTLADHMKELASEMPVSKPGLLISDLLNEESAKKRSQLTSGAPIDEATEFLQWKNDKHSKRKAFVYADPSVNSFQEVLLKGQEWICKCLRTLGSTWPDRIDNGGAMWRSSVQTIDKVEDFATALFALENELMSAQKKPNNQRSGTAALSPAAADASKNASTPNEEYDKNEERSDDEDDDEEEEAIDLSVDDGKMLWPSKYCRERWIQSVKRGKTVAVMATALASLIHRLKVLGFLNASDEDAMKTRAKSEKEKQSRKERAAKKKKQIEEVDDGNMRESVDEWEEDCYICSEGGEVVCCDGCPHVFHYSCIGLRRIPRGKIFCHECDTSVKPVVPTEKNGKASVKRPRRSHSPLLRRRPRKQAKLVKDELEFDGSDAESDSAVLTSARPASGKTFPIRHAHVENYIGPKTPEDQWDVDCSVCSLGGELLCCDGCPRAFHVKCIGLPEVPETEWFCNECNLQECGVCKKNKIRLDSHVICGSEDGSKGCDRVFHLKCAKLDIVPADDWYCKKCCMKLNL